MSSHREAPEISKDPAADSTDVYAFVSPDKQDTVTLIANFIPFQNPDGGPNFYAFGTDVRYEIHIYNTLVTDRDQAPDITYQFDFTETYKTGNSYMYNTGTIGVDAKNPNGDSKYPNLNRTQTYTVTKVTKGSPPAVIGSDIPVPPCNVGIHSTPNYPKYVPPAIVGLSDGSTVFAGQRADPFFVDLGAVFDLADLRPLQFLHTGPLLPAPGVDSFTGVNVFSIALQIPKTKLTPDGKPPTDVMSAKSVIGVYASASRQSEVRAVGQPTVHSGPYVQVARLANPLFNEVLVGIADKDRWNHTKPTTDEDFVDGVSNPEIARGLPVLYPLPFRNLAYYNSHNIKDGKQVPDRQDLVAILLTGVPATVIPGFQNFTGPRQADLMRLNMAIPVAAKPNPLGVIGGDLQGFPNGRRLADDVVDIELKAIAGATLPLTEKTGFKTDLAVALVADYAGPSNGGFLPSFPYVTTPSSGFASMPRAYAPG